MPDSEALSSMPTSAPPVSLLMSLRSARLLPCTESWKKEEAERIDVMLLVWGTNGKWAAQRAQCGRVETKLGRKTKECLVMVLEKATWATMRCMSSGRMGLVTGSPLQDWELAKVALSCHMALDKLCQEMQEAGELGDATERPPVTA